MIQIPEKYAPRPAVMADAVWQDNFVTFAADAIFRKMPLDLRARVVKDWKQREVYIHEITGHYGRAGFVVTITGSPVRATAVFECHGPCSDLRRCELWDGNHDTRITLPKGRSREKDWRRACELAYVLLCNFDGEPRASRAWPSMAEWWNKGAYAWIPT